MRCVLHAWCFLSIGRDERFQPQSDIQQLCVSSVAMSAPVMKFSNRGNSCFVNAGLQAFLPLKGFESLRPTTASERALLESRAAAAESVGAVVPQAVLDLYYQGRQEDCAEFLVELLADCPSVHRQLRGKEQAYLACRSCGYRRATASEEFLTLQVPLLAGEHRLGSVQEALNHYLEREEVVEDIIHWACENPACSAAGRAGQLPKRRTTVAEWPETLVMSLNRWDNRRGLLPHPVHVDLELRLGGDDIRYRLQSVVSHIGELANSGHYVAYRPAAGGFERFDDSTISFLRDNPGHVSREKVYVVCYTRVRDLDPLPVLPAKRPVIDLEDDSEDSDVVVAPDSTSPAVPTKMEAKSEAIDGKPMTRGGQPHAKKGKTQGAEAESSCEKSEAIDAKPMTRSGQPHAKGGKTQGAEAESSCEAQREQPMQRKQLGNFANYAAEDRRIILTALRDSDTFAIAVRTIRAKVKHFTLHEKTSFRLHRNTLMGWFRRPELGPRAERLVTTPMPKAVFSRKPSRTSSLASMAPQQQEQIVEALSSGSKPCLSVFQGTGAAPSDNLSIPPSTVRRWVRLASSASISEEEGRPAAAKAVSQACHHTTWAEEREFNFSVVGTLPKGKQTKCEDEDPSSLWLLEGSWTFCPVCGRRRARSKTQRWSIGELTSHAVCRPSCDTSAVDLLAQAPEDVRHNRILVYTTPERSVWHSWSAAISSGALPLTAVLSPEELKDLAVLTIHVDFRARRGGKAEITSKQKTSLTRCRWRPRPLRELPRSDLAARAFRWLLEHNPTYRAWVDRHANFFLANGDLDAAHKELQTAEMLLRSPGIEVAVRPWLYPLPSLADTDYQERLVALGWLSLKSKPSIRTGFMRKLESRCLDYSIDFPLHCLLYDTCMAKTISSVQAIADRQKTAPEQVASDMDGFDVYWHQQLRKMEDICRQEYERNESLEEALPSVFFTVAPAEWRYLLHNGVFHDTSLSEQQTNITLHLYHTLEVMLQYHILKDGASLQRIGLAGVRQWSYRFEFQSRGTLHVHCVLWANLLPDRTADDLCGRTGKTYSSEFVRLLEEIFQSRADVQCGDGSHNLLQYVAGYVSKASDALSFAHPQAQREGSAAEQSKWRQTYRLLCKRSPMEQEVVMEFAGLPMVKHSFSGVALFAPIPGSKAKNASRDHYLAYQFFLQQPADAFGCASGLSFMQWMRKFRVVDVEKKILVLRNAAGPMKNMNCGLAISFPFELLDIFVGAWAATFLPDVLEHRLYPEVDEDARHYGQEHAAEQQRRASFAAPEGFKHLKAVLCLDRFQLYRRDPMVFHPNVGELLALVEKDLILRGLTADRIATFKARIHACTLLLCAFRDGHEDPTLWTARSVSAPPARIWSREQQEVLNHVQRGTTVSDAADMETSRRVLQVAGGPGTGKTEVIIAAVRQALEDGCRVLIAGPIGLLVSMYRLRLPHLQNLTMETLHSAFRITRDADAAYIPPGRLRQYDLIVVDEVSQIDSFVWRKLKTALGELRPCPFVVFVGDFQQLQPLQGGPELQTALEKQREDNLILYVKLEHHEAARSVDPEMLDFLEAARLEQPSREALVHFFGDRLLPADPVAATRVALNLEDRTHERFTFLTVRNQGAASLNLARLQLQFPEAARVLKQGGGIPADDERVVVAAGMRIRLTLNVDKERGFVNGNTGMVRSILRPDVFLLHSDQGVPILVHPVTQKGRKFLPVTYGWATTMRRAQGATLEKVGLWFDRKLPDRGYAYVGISRAKRRSDVFLMGKIRRTDWRPVGGEGRPGEQIVLGPFSESTDDSDISSFGGTDDRSLSGDDFSLTGTPETESSGDPSLDGESSESASDGDIDHSSSHAGFDRSGSE